MLLEMFCCTTAKPQEWAWQRADGHGYWLQASLMSLVANATPDPGVELEQDRKLAQSSPTSPSSTS